MKYPNLRWILFCYNVRLEELAAKLAHDRLRGSRGGSWD
jgi:hypothetical protein